MTSKAELLSPAGNIEAFYAAVNAGCDAVYLGLKSFGARASASNFNEEDLIEARKVSAFYGIKIYVTLNTLIKQDEIESILDSLKLIIKIGVDAVIVQDIGLAYLIKHRFPTIPLHASTQMAIHTVYGAKFLKDFGFSRVVLARECSLDTIKQVKALGIETEVFIHGALCVSMSGQCLLSSFAGGRSGNRGRCAQACRQRFKFDNKNGMWLSTRDIMLYNDLKDLIDIGVDSLKVEGRMKSPSYVSTVISQYREALDNIYLSKFEPLSVYKKQEIMQVFNRGEFSSYVSNNEDFGIINPERSNHNGVHVGKVKSFGKKLVEIDIIDDINDGDMLQIRKNNGQENDIDIIYSGKNSPAGSTIKSYIRDGLELHKGLDVYRLISQKQIDSTKELKRDGIPVNVYLRLEQNKEAMLCINDGYTEHTELGDVCQVPKNQAISREKLISIINKTDKISLNIKAINLFENSIFLPISSLNNLRRCAYENFAEKIIAKNTPKFFETDWTLEKIKYSKTLAKTIVISSCPELSKEVLANGDEFIFYPTDLREKEFAASLQGLSKNFAILIPSHANDKDIEYLVNAVSKNTLLVLDNIGQLGIIKENFALGPNVPIINNYSLKAFEEFNPKFVTVFPETSNIELNKLEKIDIPWAIKIYGRERLMILNHCPARTALGLSKNKDKCRMCHDNEPNSLLAKSFLDKKGYDFPLRPIFRSSSCIVEMFNSLPGYINKNIDTRFSKILHFTFENYEVQSAIYNAFKTNDSIEIEKAIAAKTTFGHFLDPVL